MLTRGTLNLETYLRKLQDVVDEMATERNLRKIIVFHHGKGIFGCVGEGAKFCLPLVEEAQGKVNERYKLKLEV